MHNKDKARLFNKYIKDSRGLKGTANELIALLNIRHITPKRAKTQFKNLRRTWGYRATGAALGELIREQANRKGFLRRLFERADAEKWANALATRCGHRWHKIERTD